MNLMKKVVIIGCGSIGKRHISNLKDLVPENKKGIYTGFTIEHSD